MPALALAALLFLLAGLIGWAALSGASAAFDRTLLLSLQVPGGTVLADLLSAITTFGDFWPRTMVGLAALALLLSRRRWADAAWLPLVVASGALIVSEIKSWTARPRPVLLPQLDTVTSLSFPSAHAANNMILWLALALLLGAALRPGWAVALALAAATVIGMSRVALAVHWPTDVIAGWAFGAGWVLFCVGLAAWVDKMWRTR